MSLKQRKTNETFFFNYKKHEKIVFFVVFSILFFFFSFNAFAKISNSNKSVKTVRVGYFPIKGFQEFDEKTNVYSGYSYEFLMAISAYTNWNYEFVHCDSFSQALNLLEEGKIDLLNDVTKLPERMEKLEFSNLSAGSACSYLLMHDEDSNFAYNDWDSFPKIKIGLDKESVHNKTLLDIFKEHGVEPNITWYNNESELVKAWDEGKVDAYAAISDTAVQGHAIMIFAPGEYYLATTKGNKSFIREVDHAVQALRSNSPMLEATIFDKYYSRVSRNYSVLTQDEKDFIKNNPVIRVLYVPDWYPISFQNENGDFTGPFRKIYDLISERIGLKFEFVPMDYNIPFENIVDTYNCYMLAEHPSDYIGASSYNVKLTQKFVNAALVEVSKGTLKKGDTLALVKGDCLTEMVQTLFGDEFNYVMEKNIDDCITKVKDGSVDGTVLMSYESEYYQSQRKYKNLIYTVVNNGSYGFCLAVSNEANSLLFSIIVKGLNSISSAEVNNIFNQMVQELKKTTLLNFILDNPIPFAISGSIFAIILVFSITNSFFSKKLKEKNEELIHANASTTQFFSRMSHDMRTPMNGILGIAELSKSDNDVNTLHQEMDKIQQSGNYLLSLINDTLDFQRIETGNMKLENEIVTYNEIFQNITELISQTAKAKKVEFKITSKKNVPKCYVWADPVRVKQIFINLLSNAIKFTPPEGVVSVEFVETKQDEKKRYGRFIIRDTGVGMSQDFIDTRMFKPFSQEHNEVSGMYAGSGLGLSIVKSLVDLMHGTIEVESELGSGTTFIVDLAFEKATDSEINQLKEKTILSDDKTVLSLEGSKILLVEDHPLNAEITMKLLHNAGCKVEWAKNGMEGVTKFKESECGYYTAILMDVRMPVMDGLEATKVIRSLGRADAKSIPIIAMSANAYEEDIKKSLEAGMNAHLAKPVESKLVYKTLSRFINLK